MISAVKEMGAFVKLHICGNITHLLPAIADLDIDILDVDHMVDMRTVRMLATVLPLPATSTPSAEFAGELRT